MSILFRILQRIGFFFAPVVYLAPVLSVLWAIWRGSWASASFGLVALGIWYGLAIRRAENDRRFQNAQARAMEAIEHARAHLEALSPEERIETEKLIEGVERELGLRKETE